MPATCAHCKFSVPCSCPLPEVITPCAVKKKAALWVIVRDQDGKGVEGVPVAMASSASSSGHLSPVVRSLTSSTQGETDSDGVFWMETEPGAYDVNVVKVPDRLARSHDLPEIFLKSVGVFEGAISHLFFDLRLRTRLIVELVGKNLEETVPDIVNDASVFLEQVVSTQYIDGRTVVNTAGFRSEKPAGVLATFPGVSKGQYRIRVVLARDKRKRYAVQDVPCEIKAGEIEKKVQVPVWELFTKVRFIGLCVAAIPRQVWKGDDDQQVVTYQVTKHKNPAAVPDFASRFSTYDEELKDYSSTYKDAQKDKWRAKYNGLAFDPYDIRDRVAFLKSAIQQAKANLGGDSDKVLKVFVAPECFFLGRYGAYPHEPFAALIQQLKDLVSGDEWKCWVFAFGTVNGFYELEGRIEMFNMSPVIKGGSAGFPADSDKFMKLLQKSMFSQEIPSRDELDPHGDELRLPLTEEKVSAGFQATYNEEIIGREVMRVLSEFRSDKRVDYARKAGIGLDEAAAMCADVEREIRTKGLYAFARLIRGDEAEATRKSKVAGTPTEWRPWMAPFKAVLAKYMAGHPEINLVLAEGARVMNPRDFAFSMRRLPGPWLDNVVEAGDTEKEEKLTFALEICADHLQGRFKTAAQHMSLSIDIHLVPSAGAFLNPDSLGSLTGGGYAFNCDGWNCPSGSGVFERKGKVVPVEDELAPRQLGRNPLLPHTELWKAKSAKAKEAEQKEFKEKTEEGKKEIARLEEQFKKDKAATDKAWEVWDKKGRKGDEPQPAFAPQKPPLPTLPSNYSYLADGVTLIELADNVDRILPYDSSDRAARWKEIESKVQLRLVQEQEEKKEREKNAREEAKKQAAADKEKEEKNLLKLVEGVAAGMFKSPSLDALEKEVALLKSTNDSKLSVRETVLTKRTEQIKTSREKIARLEAQLLDLTQPLPTATGAAAAGTFTLPPMQKRAVPQLHIYPEQDLPVPV